MSFDGELFLGGDVWPSFKIRRLQESFQQGLMVQEFM
jgi:hypothetical protein